MATKARAQEQPKGKPPEIQKKVADPRSTINQKHPFVSVVIMSIMGVMAGSSGPTAIAEWAQSKKEFLLKTLDLPNGLPRKDVFRRVLALLNPAAFQACFVEWLGSLRDAVAAATEITQPVLAVDGKTLRRSHDRSKGLGALHSVSIWASEFGLSLGQVACAEKSNEITAIPELLKLVDIQGSIITIDAMGTQKAIAGVIIEEKADYVLALKGNQGTLHDGVIDYIDRHGENGFADIKVRSHTTMEKAHGREEIRSYFHMAGPGDLAGLEQWAGLRSIGKVISVCKRDGKETVETRYYISSLAVGVKRFAHAIRSHWGIENSCHLEPRHDLPRRRITDPRQADAREYGLVESVHPLASATTQKRKKHSDESPPLWLERRNTATNPYGCQYLMAAGPEYKLIELLAIPPTALQTFKRRCGM